jgi:hypothetical protein
MIAWPLFAGTSSFVANADITGSAYFQSYSFFPAGRAP